VLLSGVFSEVLCKGKIFFSCAFSVLACFGVVLGMFEMGEVVTLQDRIGEFFV